MTAKPPCSAALLSCALDSEGAHVPFLFITSPGRGLLVSSVVQKTSMLPPTFLSACLQRGSGTIGAFLPEASYEWPYLLLVFVTKSCFVVVVVVSPPHAELFPFGHHHPLFSMKQKLPLPSGEIVAAYTVRHHKTQTPLGTMGKTLLNVATS